jgi:serine/threonine protein kinase
VIQRIGVAGMLDWRYGYKVALHIGQVLAYTHGQNIIHRNLTPKNILLEAPTKLFKLGDLMLAKALEGSLALPNHPAGRVNRRGGLHGTGADAGRGRRGCPLRPVRVRSDGVRALDGASAV